MDKEIWKETLIEDNAYLVSNKGRIAKLCKISIKGTPRQGNRGYAIVNMIKGGKQKSIKIHRLVADLFIPNPENKTQVNHINGIKTDNRVENLEWVTPSENMIHAFNTGLNHSGEKHPKAKLTDEQRIEIINNYIPYDRLFGSRALARKYGVDHQSILYIIKKYKRKGNP